MAPAPPTIRPEVPVKHVPRPVVVKPIEDGRWFATAGSDCSGATGLRAAEFELTLPAPTAAGFVLLMSVGQSQKNRPSGPIRIGFRNSRDSWADTGRLTHGISSLTLPNDAATLSKFLLLFEGGTLSITYLGHNDRISVPRAGVAQQKWFDCAKSASLE